MLTNKETEDLVKQIFKDMETDLNSIEVTMTQPTGTEEINLAKLGFYFGSLREDYKILVKLLNIFGEPKSE